MVVYSLRCHQPVSLPFGEREWQRPAISLPFREREVALLCAALSFIIERERERERGSHHCEIDQRRERGGKEDKAANPFLRLLVDALMDLLV